LELRWDYRNFCHAPAQRKFSVSVLAHPLRTQTAQMNFVLSTKFYVPFLNSGINFFMVFKFFFYYQAYICTDYFAAFSMARLAHIVVLRISHYVTQRGNWSPTGQHRMDGYT